MIKKILKYIRLHLGISDIKEICKNSNKKDFHDYPKNKGGDGIPSHFYKYKCWNCGKVFEI